MSIQLERKSLINSQQLEVAVNGPDGATHLIICTGVAELGTAGHETYSFLVGPLLTRHQFVNAIASAAFSEIQVGKKATLDDPIPAGLGANVIQIDASYDDESRRVKVTAEVSATTVLSRLSISYDVNILAELQKY